MFINTMGYVLPKSNFSRKEIDTIKTELTIIPAVLNPVANEGPPKKFPIWKESEKTGRLYVPRFFGIERWGIPLANTIPLGNPIDVPFKGTLRPIQQPIVEKYLDHVNDPLNGGGALLELYCAMGKTVMALNIISRLQTKTLIMVHKEFLMNQWIERANEFLPTARIGRIQGTTFDTDNKDIVIGMVQTMYNKIYQAGTFDSFGFCIFDEVHRFGSEQFSKIFFKVSPRFLLGITATMDRKDDTTPLLKHFIGPVIYKIVEREMTEQVQVRAIVYKEPNTTPQNPPFYLEVITDRRDTVMYSSMIVRICAHKPRTLAIFQIIGNLLQEFPKAQIMVLSLNLELLNDLATFLENTDITFGYYVGGMRKKALAETETKQVVLATFSMAQEALDIKTLSTLILATSKTDIVQAVGRILRSYTETPKLIVDIIDPNTTFENQWKKRLTYYRKCDYQIHKCDWETYQQVNDPFRESPNPEKYRWETLTKKKKKSTSAKKSSKSCVATSDSDDDDDDDDDNSKIKKGVCLI